MMEEFQVAPVRSKSFPLQERSIWERLEDEQGCQQKRAMEKLCGKVQEEQKKKEMAQEEERRQECQKNLLTRVAKGEELLRQLHEQADAHEQVMKKSAKELKVRIT